MKTEEEKIREILKSPVESLKDYRSIRECADELGYKDAGHVRNRVASLKLGISFSKLGINSISAHTILLSPEDFEILKASLEDKQKAGRKPLLKKEESNG